MELGSLRLHYLRIMNTPEINDSTDRLHLEVDKDLKIKEAHIECFQEIPDSFLRRLADIRTEQDAKFRKRDDDLELRLVASVHGAVAAHWATTGLNLFDGSATDTEAGQRLINEHLTTLPTPGRTEGRRDGKT